MIRAEAKRVIRSRYVLRCGYCSVTEQEIGAELTYDHFKPISAGGTDDIENIVYACHSCNSFMGHFWREAENECLLHPLRDDFNAHISEDQDGILAGLSKRGTVHVERLHLNRSPLTAHRLERKIGAQSREELKAFRELLNTILTRLAEFEGRPPN